MKSAIAILTATTLVAAAKPDGAQLFTQNCSACHLLDQMVVGPSLAEMRTIYEGKPDLFVKWAIEPQKKRPNAIEMPSMVHVGEEGLRAIYEHVMKVSKGVEDKKQKSGDPHANSPVLAERPRVQRIFMPNAGPAAIAVALDDGISVCWDAGEGRLRYSWNGGFIDGFPYWKGNGSSLAKILGDVRYTEAQSPFAKTDGYKFLGYSLKDKLPVFSYRLGNHKITEYYTALPNGGGFKREFTISPPPSSGIELQFPSDQSVGLESDKGKWTNSKLKLSSSEAAAFTITTSFK
ncbi:MAG: c-type cytochrome [Akkermansiaceae bacterium]